MELKKSELESVLKSVAPGLAKQEISDEATRFFFSEEFVATFNGRICVYHPFETEMNFSVPANEFLKVLSSISEEKISLKEVKNTLVVSSKSTKAKINMMATADTLVKVIHSRNYGKMKFQSLPDDFMEALRLCHFSASKDVTSDYYGVFCDGVCVFASDRYRQSVYELAKKMKTEFVLPYMSVVELLNYPVVEYCDEPSMIHFRTEEGVIFSTVKLDTKPYDYDSFFASFEESDETIEVQIPSDMKKVVDSIMFMGAEKVAYDEIMELDFEDGELTCTSINRSTNSSINKTVKIDYDGEPITLRIVPRFLSDILEHATTMKATSSQAMFSHEGGKFEHLMVLHANDDTE